jgi:Protein of unknown function (DUF4446)
MHNLTTTQGIVALAAGGVAIVALVLAVVLAFRLRRVGMAQRAVLGESGKQDLVAHAARLEDAFLQLRAGVEEAAARLDVRMATVEDRLDGCVAYLSLIRYDAYGEMSGRQSSSLALLDSRRSGVVLSSILHRDQARVYVKQVHEGQSEFELSPEEQQAVETALSRGAGARAEA